MLRAGITTDEINDFVHEDTLRRGSPGAAQLPRLPEERLHVDQRGRLPRHSRPQRVLKDGDIINVDVTTFTRAFTATRRRRSTSASPSADAKHVVEVARKSLELGIAAGAATARGSATSAPRSRSSPRRRAASVVRDFVGHGIGRKFHETPQVKHYGKRGTGDRLQGRHDLHHRADDQHRRLRGRGRSTTSGPSSPPTARSPRSSSTPCSSRKTGVEILTKRAAPLVGSEIFPDYFSK